MLFHYYSGSGNRFLISSCLPHELSLYTPDSIREIANRATPAVDGILLAEFSPLAALQATLCAFRMHYFNRDGSRASMCGNGLRAISRYVFDVHPHVVQHHTQFLVLTDCGIRRATILQDGTVEVDMGSYILLEKVEGSHTVSCVHSHVIQLPDGQTKHIYAVNTGVPHAVLLSSHITQEHVDSEGLNIRHHSLFYPDGANVTYLELLTSHSQGWDIAIRTYERGVEAETGACGTGACAAAITLLTLHHSRVCEHNEFYVHVVFPSQEHAYIRCAIQQTATMMTAQILFRAAVCAFPEQSVQYLESSIPSFVEM